MNVPVIYLAFANDRDDYLPLLKEESSNIRHALKGLHRKQYIEVTHEESAELKDIYSQFIEFRGQISIFHYGGHASGTHLRLEDQEGDAAGLATLIGQQENLKLVFLNGCSTREQVDLLFAAGVKAVIATVATIEDEIAVEFATMFYDALAKRHTIGQSFKLAASFVQERHGTVIGINALVGRGERVYKPEVEKELQWGLYIQEPYFDEILHWKLPFQREIGLPQDMLAYIGNSFKANRYIMLVLDEMTRYNPDIYDQMVERRGSESYKKDSKYYPELVIKNFPWPIGAQIRLLRLRDRPDIGRLEQLISTYIITSMVLCYILLSDLWEKVRNKELELNTDFEFNYPKNKETFMSFDFFGMIPMLFSPFQANDVPPYVIEFQEMVEDLRDTNSRLYRACQFLENLRVSSKDKAYGDNLDKLCQQAEQAVAVILQSAAFLGSYRMLTVRDILIQAPRYEPVSYELDMGPLNAAVGIDLNLYQDAAQRHKNSYGNSHSIVLVRTEDNLKDCLNLSPFIVDKNTFVRVSKGTSTDRDKLAHIFLVAYPIEDQQVLYLAVDHSIFVALEKEEDRITTQMTNQDFQEGRNMVDTGDPFGDFDLEDEFGFDDFVSEDESPPVFALLRDQFNELLVDMMPVGRSHA